MSENIFYEKLNRIAWKTEGIFLSSALLENAKESSSFSKFCKKYPEMFSIIYDGKVKIYRARQPFFQFFSNPKNVKFFDDQEEILVELLHSCFLLDGHFDCYRKGKVVTSKGIKYELDDFNSNSLAANIIAFEQRQFAFNPEMTKVLIPSTLKSKWSRLCLQGYFMNEVVIEKNESGLISPDRAKALMDEVIL